MNNKIIAGAVAAAVIGLSPMTASAVNFKDVMAGKTDFSIGGYIKVDASWDDHSDGDATHRRSYSGIATGDGSTGESGRDLEMHARESRINFKTSSKIDGHKLLSYIEIDFLGTDSSGSETVSNAYAPRLRHAFLKYDNWTVGQTWSNFMSLGAFPESVDFVGPIESVVFVRQPLVQYTSGAWSVSLENPHTIGAADSGDGDLPDLTAKYTHKGDFGYVSVAGLVRELSVDKSAGVSEDTTMGWGLSVSGKINVGAKDNIKFQVTESSGAGRYVGVFRAGTDVVTDATGNLDAVASTAGFAAYQHWWSDKLRSSVILSAFEAEHEGQGGLVSSTSTALESQKSVQVNLMFSPVKPLTFGVMYLKGERELFSGVDGDINIIQASAKYAF